MNSSSKSLKGAGYVGFRYGEEFRVSGNVRSNGLGQRILELGTWSHGPEPKPRSPKSPVISIAPFLDPKP